MFQELSYSILWGLLLRNQTKGAKGSKVGYSALVYWIAVQSVVLGKELHFNINSHLYFEFCLLDDFIGH